jgi:hypothetical protein
VVVVVMDQVVVAIECCIGYQSFQSGQFGIPSRVKDSMASHRPIRACERTPAGSATASEMRLSVGRPSCRKGARERERSLLQTSICKAHATQGGFYSSTVLVNHMSWWSQRSSPDGSRPEFVLF